MKFNQLLRPTMADWAKYTSQLLGSLNGAFHIFHNNTLNTIAELRSAANGP